MGELYKRGDRVKHAVKTDWGLGEVLEDQVGDKVRIIFEDVGVKSFALQMPYDIGAAKWTVATYFLFLAFPDSRIFVKPEVTKHAARVLGIDIAYEPDPLTHKELPTYSR